MTGFTFNNTKSKSMYIRAIKTNRILVAKRKHSTVIIPESDNVILIPDVSREPITVSVECFIVLPPSKSIFDVGREFDSWLVKDDWSRLIFDDDPNYYYEAVCTSEIRVDELRDKTKNVLTLEFLCKAEQKAV